MGGPSSTKLVQLGLVLCTAAGLAPLAWHINSATAQDGARAQAEIQLLTTITGLRACSSLGMLWARRSCGTPAANSIHVQTYRRRVMRRRGSFYSFIVIHVSICTRIRIRIVYVCSTHTHTHTHTHIYGDMLHTHTPGCTDLPPHPMPWCGASDGLIPGRQAMRKGNVAVSTSGAAG